MKYTFETNDELEAKQLLAAKDCLYILHDLKEKAYQEQEINSGYILTAIDNKINLDDLWT